MIIKQMNYDDYVALQKEKTEDPIRRQKWLANRTENARKFMATFQQPEVFSRLPLDKGSRCLCVGARTGEEVMALIMMGYTNAVGMDLVPCDGLVVQGDMHDMPFEDNSFGFLYTNVIDHSLQPEKFISETCRVLEPNGTAFFQLQVGTAGDRYGVNDVESPDEFCQMIVDVVEREGLEVAPTISVNRPTALTPHNHGLNWNVVVELGVMASGQPNRIAICRGL